MLLHHGWASNQTWTASQISISYVYKVILHIEKLWMDMASPLAWYAPWVKGQFSGIGVGTDLSDVVTSWLSLKPHLESFTNQDVINIKSSCNLIRCEWVSDITVSLIPSLSLGWIFRNWRRDQPVWCSYIMVEPQTTLGVLHKSMSYIYKVILHLDMLWMGTWHHPYNTLPESRVNFQGTGVETDLSDVFTSWLILKPHLECFTNLRHMYIKWSCTLICCEWVYGISLSLIPPWV